MSVTSHKKVKNITVRLPSKTIPLVRPDEEERILSFSSAAAAAFPAAVVCPSSLSPSLSRPSPPSLPLSGGKGRRRRRVRLVVARSLS